MKKVKFFNIPLLIIAAVFLFVGCSIFNSKKAAQTNAGVSQSSSSSAVSSNTSDDSQAAEETSSKRISSSSGSIALPESGSFPGPVSKVETENKSFDNKFKNNPIDKKYIQESNNAVSNLDMEKVSDKYSKVWQNEIKYAYSELEKYMKTDSSSKPAKLKAEQEKWEKDKDENLRKIENDTIAAGGSMAPVNEASARMDFYRARAAAVYSELYSYNKNFTYKFGY